MSSIPVQKTFDHQILLPIVTILTALGPHHYLLFFLSIQPLLGFTNHEEWDLLKHLFNRMLVLSLLIYTLLTISSVKGNISFVSNGWEGHLSVYLFSVVVSIVAAVSFGDANIGRSISYLVTVPILISLVFVVGYWIDTAELVMTALRYFLVSAVVVCVLGLCEFVILGLSDGFGSYRIRSLFSDPNIFARYILLAIFFLIPFLFYRNYSLFRKKTLIIFLTLFLVNLLFSLSRSGYLTLIIGCIVFSFFIESKKIRTAIVSSSIVIGIVIFMYLLSQRSFTGSAIIEPSNINRFLLVLGGIDMIQSHWLTGVGYTNFAHYFERHYIENYLSLSSESYKVSGFATEIHSWIIEVWAEQGITGLLVFLAMFRRYFVIMHKAIVAEMDGTMRNILLGFFMSVFVFLFQGLFYHTFISQFFFWLIAGFGIAALQISNKQRLAVN